MTKKETIHVAARVPTKIVERFDKLYPYLGRQYFLNECFKHAVNMAELELPADELIEKAVKRVAQKRADK